MLTEDFDPPYDDPLRAAARSTTLARHPTLSSGESEVDDRGSVCLWISDIQQKSAFYIWERTLL